MSNENESRRGDHMHLRSGRVRGWQRGARVGAITVPMQSLLSEFFGSGRFRTASQHRREFTNGCEANALAEDAGKTGWRLDSRIDVSQMETGARFFHR